MYQIKFNKNPHIFDGYKSTCLDALKQIIIESNQSAYIIDTSTAEIVFEHNTEF